MSNIYKDLYEANETEFFLKICEELGELQTSVLHYKDKKCNYSDILKELADVTFQLEKIAEWVGGFDDETVEQVYSNITGEHIKIKETLTEKYGKKNEK